MDTEPFILVFRRNEVDVGGIFLRDKDCFQDFGIVSRAKATRFPTADTAALVKDVLFREPLRPAIMVDRLTEADLAPLPSQTEKSSELDGGPRKCVLTVSNGDIFLPVLCLDVHATKFKFVNVLEASIFQSRAEAIKAASPMQKANGHVIVRDLTPQECTALGI